MNGPDEPESWDCECGAPLDTRGACMSNCSGSTTEDTARYSLPADATRMHEQLVEMGGAVSWNHLTGKWHASANRHDGEFGMVSSFYVDGETPEEAIAKSHEQWLAAGAPTPVRTTGKPAEYLSEWCDQQERDRKAGEAARLAGGQ